MGNRQAGLHRAAAPLASGSGPDSTEQDRFLAAQLQVPVRLVGREPVGIAEVDQALQLLTHDLEALAVGVLDGAALPGTMGIAEVNGDAGVNAEASVSAHLVSLVPGQGAHELVGQVADLRGDGVAGDLGPSTLGKVNQQHATACARAQAVSCCWFTFPRVDGPRSPATPSPRRSATCPTSSCAP